MTAGARIFVTGGTGFFGRSLLRHWSARSAPPMVTVLTRSRAAFLGRYPEFASLDWLGFAEGDVTEAGSFPGGAFTHVIHAATESTIGPTLRPIERYRQIMAGTENALAFARACGAGRFLLTSSGGVYGAQPADMERVPETYCGMPDPLLPGSAYSVAKRASEHLCALYQDEYGLETVVARCFAFVGPDLPLDVHFAIGNFIGDAIAGNDIVVTGSGAPLRSYLHQDDLAWWLDHLLVSGTAGEAYNVGSDEAISIRDLAHLVRDLVAPHRPVRVALPLPPGPPSRYIPDISKARELGLQVRVGLSEAILSTYRELTGPR
ncbi:MAG: NAD(P)-dependent oxidoreductase [Bradyrhizobium sp.]|nr:NAD(P)-dependent oxidoreductase [Bradyrhizobium sp.]MCA3580006.1 NAD(P)-dependent oxidoreductase [Bradyrhizobium sp.]